MPAPNRVIRASEVGTFVYCARAWWLGAVEGVPAENVGDITGDLASRRGRVVGQEMLAGNFIVIKAQVPLAEVAQYTGQLKSVTGGRGSHSMTFSHYELVPPNVQQQIVAQYGKKKEGD